MGEKTEREAIEELIRNHRDYCTDECIRLAREIGTLRSELAREKRPRVVESLRAHIDEKLAAQGEWSARRDAYRRLLDEIPVAITRAADRAERAELDSVIRTVLDRKPQ